MTKYTPIDSVLYGLSLTISTTDWNRNSAVEWGLRAARMMGGLSLFTDKVDWFLVTEHTLKVPTDLRILHQIEVNKESLTNSYSDNTILLDKIQRRINSPHPELFLNMDTIGTVNKSAPWRMVYKSTGSFINACNFDNIRNCVPEYKEDGNTLKFSFKEGVIGMSYAAYASDGESYLIPDIEDYKEAIRRYILYQIYEAKCRVEPSQFNLSERDRNAKLYSSAALKGIGKVNEAKLDTNTIENVKNIRSRLLPRSNMWEKGFHDLGKPESGKLF